MDLTGILQAAVEEGASDIVLKDGRPPMFRVRGDLTPCPGAPALSAQQLQEAATTILQDDSVRLRFATERHADLAFDEPGLGRFRVNVFRQRGRIGIVLRGIPTEVRAIAELNLPPIVEQLADERRGLVLVTGPTGSGKSTTLAAMIEHINQTSARHVITIEDPIEYVHREQQSIISQRQIGEDVNDFPSALQAALRQNPDVIMLGEMRDLATIETAMMAAETGHLVLSTLHTSDAPETVLRVISAFPEHQRDQARLILAAVLRGVISQRLVRSADGSGLLPAVEIMVGTPRVREYVEKQRVRDLPELIGEGLSYGMQSFDQALMALYQSHKITHGEALAHCRNSADFEMHAKGLESAGSSLKAFESRS